MHSLNLFSGCGTLFQDTEEMVISAKSSRNCSTDFFLIECQVNYCEIDLVVPCWCLDSAVYCRVFYSY